MAADAKRDRKYWEGIVERCRASGASMLAFAREHRVSYTQLVRWRRRIESGGANRPGVTLIPVSVAMADSGSGVLVRLSQGVQIEVARGFDAEVLRGAEALSRTSPILLGRISPVGRRRTDPRSATRVSR